jgi:hypothetical protein
MVFSSGRFSVRVREVEATGNGVAYGSSIAYRRVGGAAIWAATPDGFEEWLHLAPGVASGEHAAAAWEIEGATARSVGGLVELVDGEGVARLRVTAPVAYARGGRRVDVRLDAKGSRIEIFVDARGEEVLVDPGWSTTGQMSTAREYATATTLQDGKVLVAGGDNGPLYLSSAELYDPTTGTWSLTGSMSTSREGHTATLLADGTVLVAGGLTTGDVSLTSAERYDPATGTWSPAGSMSQERFGLAAARLADGRVLLAGGGPWGQTPSTYSEIYDPATSTWSATGPMVVPHVYATATLLQSGRVLLAGGANGVGFSVSNAELYDPASNTWTATTNAMTSPRVHHTAALLANGKVLVLGGLDNPSAGQYSYPAASTCPFGSSVAV